MPRAKQLLASVNRVGARAMLVHEDERIVETVWIRNIGSEFGGFAAITAQRIASYLVKRQFLERHEQTIRR